MGVYIKGMEMPTSPVLFCIHPDGKVVADLEGGWREYKAVPVPPHGRLGDLDELYKEVKDMAKEFPPDSIGAERYRLFAEFIKTAPTIIPAEEGEK